MNNYKHYLNESSHSEPVMKKDPISGKEVPMRLIGEFLRSNVVDDINYVYDPRNGDISIRNRNKEMSSKEHPSHFSKDGTKTWYLNNEISRVGGPAVEYSNGDYEWWIDGVLHREDGPALKKGSSYIWAFNGFRHRDNGPAHIDPNSKVFDFYLKDKPSPKSPVLKDGMEKDFWDLTKAKKVLSSDREMQIALRKNKDFIHEFTKKDGTVIRFTSKSIDPKDDILYTEN